jgi:hypothetical protein
MTMNLGVRSKVIPVEFSIPDAGQEVLPLRLVKQEDPSRISLRVSQSDKPAEKGNFDAIAVSTVTTALPFDFRQVRHSRTLLGGRSDGGVWRRILVFGLEV